MPPSSSPPAHDDVYSVVNSRALLCKQQRWLSKDEASFHQALSPTLSLCVTRSSTQSRAFIDFPPSLNPLVFFTNHLFYEHRKLPHRLGFNYTRLPLSKGSHNVDSPTKKRNFIQMTPNFPWKIAFLPGEFGAFLTDSSPDFSSDRTQKSEILRRGNYIAAFL